MPVPERGAGTHFARPLMPELDQDYQPLGSFRMLGPGGRIQEEVIPGEDDMIKTKAVQFDRFAFCTRHGDCTCKTKQIENEDSRSMPCLVDGHVGDVLDCGRELFNPPEVACSDDESSNSSSARRLQLQMSRKQKTRDKKKDIKVGLAKLFGK